LDEEVKDTDLKRSTRKSEEAVLADLAWLGLEWEEGALSTLYYVYCSHIGLLFLHEFL
jgi:glutamyl/glutaminyl-tRNA synthetase